MGRMRYRELYIVVKTLGRDFLLRLIKSGVNKPSITGDLWSEAAGMGLFGIYAHERHTAVSIKKWTEEALTAIGFNSSKELLEHAYEAGKSSFIATTC
ncbi:hypothetical protein AB1Y20_012117 [Prymnesium parvum]|uniref:Uncharacterized protein n=1 Tax=Prymnesium parvum TaxID=97485 RepID=A0AB34IQ11_PRYPA